MMFNGWTAVGAIVALAALGFAIYSYKANSLTSAKDRRNHLQGLEGKSMREGDYQITIDNIEFKEATGVLYRLKRLLLRPIGGTIYITVRLHDIGVPDKLWDMEHGDILRETNDFNVECVNSQIHPNYTALVFEMNSAEYEDMRLFLSQLLKFFNALEETGTISLQWHTARGLPF